VQQGTNGAVSWRESSPGIALVELDSPPANALGSAIIEGIGLALDAAADARVMVVASKREGFFAAGADIKLMATIDASGFSAYGDILRSTLDRLASRLSIAAVDGLALGGGLELAMACTMRIGGSGAKFGLPEVKLGLIPGAGGTQRLPRLVGRGHALDIMLTARQLDADEAFRIGLVDRLVGAGTALEWALALATDLLGSSAAAQAAVLRTVDAAFDLPIDEGKALERDEVGRAFAGDGREGLTAFIEKRKPVF
jgi:enoyl-CoA hydratase/carnithine racemase